MWRKLWHTVRFSRKQQKALFFFICTFAIFLTLKPYPGISIPDVSKLPSKLRIDLNTADSASLEALPGIGPILAARIIKYRNRVGCFLSKDEIREVYGISQEWYEKMHTQITVKRCINKKHFNPNQYKKSKFPDYKSKTYDFQLNRPSEKLDLNSVDSAEISAFRLIPDFMLSRVLHERNKINCYTSWIQLERIWGMETHWLDTLQAWTHLGPCPNNNQEPIHSKQFKEFVPIQINEADEADLIRIPGVGKGLAKRILQYREKLGFYLHPEQLYEIYKSPESDIWAEIFPYLLFDMKDNLSFLLVNEMDIKTLAQHPYVGFSLARRIVHYREQHGRFASMESLTKIYGVKPETWDKITPYIRLDATRSTTPQDH